MPFFSPSYIFDFIGALVTGGTPAVRDPAVCNGVPTQGNEGYAVGREQYSRVYVHVSNYKLRIIL